MNAIALLRSTRLFAFVFGVAVIVGGGTAGATNGRLGTTGSIDAGTSSSVTGDITITGDPVTDPTDGAGTLALDGEYAVAAGATRATAILGAVAFDPTGAVLGGSLSFIGGSAPTMATAVDPTTGVGTPTVAAPAGTAIVTDCTVSGGSYSLSESGAGEAQLQLDCAGAGTEAVTWKLFVVAGDGFSLAQTFRAVQLEPLPGATDGEIVDLTLTLR